MNSRQRVEAALNHQQPDRVPLDLGASAVTGMHVSSVYKLRQALNLDPPGTPVPGFEISFSASATVFRFSALPPVPMRIACCAGLGRSLKGVW